MQCPLCKSDISVYEVIKFNGEPAEWCGACRQPKKGHDVRIYADTKEEVLSVWEKIRLSYMHTA